MAARYVSDVARANWSSLAAGAVGFGATTVFIFASGDAAPGDVSTVLTVFSLFTWPAFVAMYLVWTHIVSASQGSRRLDAAARTETASLRRWWVRVFGYGGASSWTLN